LPNNILKFEVDNVDLIYQTSDNQLAIAEIWVCHAGNNLHNKPISLENLKRAAPTLLNKFLVADYENGDFTTHTPDEKIIGFFPKENNLRYEEKDGKTYLVVNAIVSKIYADWAMDVFDKENHRPVSMEIEVISVKRDEQGREEIVDFAFIGVTVLSKRTQEACVGSSAEITKFSIEEAEKFYQDYAKSEFSRYAEINFTITPKIKKNCKEGLELHKQNNGATPVALAMARFIGANNNISPDRVIKINKYLSRNIENVDFDEKASPEYINFQCFGGNAARKWAKNIVDLMDMADEEKMTYFTGENTGGEDEESETQGKEENTIYMDENEMKDKQEEEKKEEMPEKEECAAGEKEEVKEEGQKEEDKKEEMAEDEKETPEDEKKEDEKESEKSDNFDAPTLMAALEKMTAEKEDAEKRFAEKDAECKQFATENEELKKFKASIEKEQMKFEVDKVLKEAELAGMPKAEIDECRKAAENVQFAEITFWANATRAKCLPFALNKKSEDDKIVRIGLPGLNGNGDNKPKTVWDRLG
jgi:hypothetical protein